MAQDATKGFIFFYDYRKHLAILTDEERGKLLMALLEYGENGTMPNLEGAALMAFSFITLQMDKDAEKYAETCRKRREAGKKGGRPKAEETEEEPEKASAFETEETEPNANEKNQSKAKKPKGYSKKQTKAKKPNTNTKTKTNTNTKTNTKNNLIILPPPLTPPECEDAPKGAEAAEVDAIPYEDIVNLYHEKCPSYPKLKKLNDTRRELIAKCWAEYEHNIDAFRELFEKAEASKFLKGYGEKGWKADFNWLMDHEHMLLVLEGKYDNKVEGSFDTDEFFEAALARSYANIEAETEKKQPITAAEDEDLRRRGDELRQRLAQ